MTIRPLVIAGAGGFARETAEIVGAVNAVEPTWELIGYVDDDPRLWGHLISGLPVLGAVDWLLGRDTMTVVCVGNPQRFDVRTRIVARLGLPSDRFATIVHPTASLASSTSIGEGSVIGANCVTTVDVEIGAHVAVMPSCVFTHDVRIGSFVTVAAGVHLAGGVTVGDGAYVGSGALVRESRSIGIGALVGMGAVVTHDVPDGERWAGIPARQLDGAGPRGIDAAMASAQFGRRDLPSDRRVGWTDPRSGGGVAHGARAES